MTTVWDAMIRKATTQTGGPAFSNGLLLALVLLSSGSLGLLLGYGAVTWSNSSQNSVMGNVPSGTFSTNEPVSSRASLSWRNAPTITSNGFER